FRDAITGEALLRQDLQDDFEKRYGAPYIVIHRSDLHSILLEACRESGVTLLNNVNVTSVETTGGRARVHAADGTIYEADLVLGADGLKSTLRENISSAADQP